MFSCSAAFLNTALWTWSSAASTKSELTWSLWDTLSLLHGGLQEHMQNVSYNSFHSYTSNPGSLLEHNQNLNYNYIIPHAVTATQRFQPCGKPLTAFGTSVAMHALFCNASAMSHWLPQPTQEITDFPAITHESWRSAQDKAALITALFFMWWRC